MATIRPAAPGHFRKTGSPELIRLEVAKTTAAAEIGASTGLFHVPRILDETIIGGKVLPDLLLSEEMLNRPKSSG